ncbi:hypothetical protein lerEdw1_007753 [Lerista edwardsae]|nr:hypothetical protein lerEdw1_007753 [Lerista edwardsae]
MTKAPFSVEWLAQSSQASKQARSREDAQQADSSTLPAGCQLQEGEPCSNSQPPAREIDQSGGKVVHRAPSEHPASLQKASSSASSSSSSADPKALAAPKRTWRATESGSDGEGNLSEGQTQEDAAGRNASSRRLRTAFSLEQISTLESSFKRHKYLGAAERRKLASKMQLSEVQIKTWFQNRRMKLKRQQQEMRPDPFHSAPFYSSLAFGHQSGPLSYVYPPHQQTFLRREAFPSSITFPTMSAPTLDSMSAPGQSGTLWPMPYFMGYQDPRTVFLTL